MIPFRVFDRQKKQMWQVINYHPNSESYLVTREDDSDSDGDMKTIPAAEISEFKFIEYVEEADSFGD